MSKRILFRCDSSSSIGLGHVKRDLVYASQLSSAEIFFACQALEGNINSLIHYPLYILQSNDIKELATLAKKLTIDEIVIDNYALTYEDEHYLKKHCRSTLSVFDDTYNRHYCDKVINHNLGACAQKYQNKVPSFCKISIIPPLIKEEFYQEKKIKREKNGIFLSLGGTDSANLSLKVLKALKQHKLPVNLATTSANPHLKALKRYAYLNRWVQLYIDADIAKLLNSSAFAIITPSVLASEAYFLKLPLLSIKTASNQTEVEKFLKQQRFMTLKQNEIHKLRNDTFWYQKRFYKPYLKNPKKEKISLKKATAEDMLDLYHLANDPLVRQNSFNSDEIKLDEHKKWLKSALKDRDIELYCLRDENNALIAQVRFNKKNKKTIISLSINQGFRGKGLAKEILEKACMYYLNTHPDQCITALIKKENASSQKSFLKAGFVLEKEEENILYYHLGDSNE